MSSANGNDRRRPKIAIKNSVHGSLNAFAPVESSKFDSGNTQDEKQSRILMPAPSIWKIGLLFIVSSTFISSIFILLRFGILPTSRFINFFGFIAAIKWTSIFRNWQDWDWGTVLAASIGVGGFIIEQRTGRQAELRQLHINRAQDQMNDLLVPINIAYNSLMFTLCGFIGAHLEEADAKDDIVLEGNGRQHDKPWDSFSSADQVMYSWPSWWISSEQGVFYSSTGKLKVAAQSEIPIALAKRISSDSSSALAAHYRLWIQKEWVPCIQNIASIILRSGHLLEAIPMSQLRETYNEPPMGGGNWKYTTRGMFFSMWLAYVRAWDTVLEQWDSGDYSLIRPTVPFPCGMFIFVTRGQIIVGDLQQELTGQSQMHGSRGINRNDA